MSQKSSLPQAAKSGSQVLMSDSLLGVGVIFVFGYPDSGKMAVAAGIKNADFTTATYKALGRLTPAEYFEGEGKRA